MSLLTRVLNFVSKINLGSFSSLKIKEFNEELRFVFRDNGLRSSKSLCEKILVAIIIMNKYMYGSFLCKKSL
jgi:hypothetical protein